jgi:hypothetical protein
MNRDWGRALLIPMLKTRAKRIGIREQTPGGKNESLILEHQRLWEACKEAKLWMELSCRKP